MSNYPYEEFNVARCSHPCEGSIGFYVDTQDGHSYLTEETFFYDYNLRQNHFQGLPHWNHERRFDDGNRIWNQRPERVEHHAIPDSPSITWRIEDNGNVINEKVVRRVPLNQVRRTKQCTNRKGKKK
jgi:type IV secretory pathway VirB9-like protein